MDPDEEDEGCYYSVVVGDNRGTSKGFHIFYRGITPVVRSLYLPAVGEAFLKELESFAFPARQDAVYTNMALFKGKSATALVPAGLVTHLAKSGRQAKRAGIALPVTSYVAVDLESGNAIPTPNILDLPSEALNGLANMNGSSRNDRFFLEEPTTVDVLAHFGPRGTNLVEPVTRGQALHQLAGTARNLDELGRVGLEALTKLAAGTRTYSLSPTHAEGMIETLAGLIG